MALILRILGYLLNTNPLLIGINSHKTEIAGGLAALSNLLSYIVPFLPLSIAATISIIGSTAATAAGYLGVIGIAGKSVKKGIVIMDRADAQATEF